MKDSYQARLEAEARLANKHPINREAQRWREEYARSEKIVFYVEPWWLGRLQVEELLLVAVGKLNEQGLLGRGIADEMLDMLWFDLQDLSPKERTRWWLGIVGEDPTELVRRLKEAKNLQEAMIQIVEVFDDNLRTDPDRSGIYDPRGTLN